ncbi:ion transporter [Nesterenkonia alba]|uniref:ion transporter n=1 Tax=Nesterenkonia alba TaxID=515814 RepID=UPI0003B30A10|nr:ion transporter [Nesterenkonia alba]
MPAHSAAATRATWRTRLGSWVESSPIQRFVIVVILVNAVVLGLETSPPVMETAGGLLVTIDTLCLAIFVVEIACKLVAFGWRFFRDPWNVFDFVVVSVALVPAGAGLEILRTLRVLRVLRLISQLPQLRKVVAALLHAVPGILSTGALLGLIFYVAAVMATTFFRDTLPEYFGGFWDSMFSLFQIATLSSWETIVRPAMDEHPWAWAFFIPFIILAAFTALNLIIAVIVDAMNTLHEMPSAQVTTEAGAGVRESGASAEGAQVEQRQQESTGQEHEEPFGASTALPGSDTPRDNEILYREIQALRADLAELKDALGNQSPGR